MRLQLRRIVPDVQAQVVVDAVRVDHLAGIHHPVGVPDLLEFSKGLNQLAPIHLLEQFSARLTISVLGGEGAPITDAKISLKPCPSRLLLIPPLEGFPSDLQDQRTTHHRPYAIRNAAVTAPPADKAQHPAT